MTVAFILALLSWLIRLVYLKPRQRSCRIRAVAHVDRRKTYCRTGMMVEASMLPLRQLPMRGLLAYPTFTRSTDK